MRSISSSVTKVETSPPPPSSYLNRQWFLVLLVSSVCNHPAPFPPSPPPIPSIHKQPLRSSLSTQKESFPSKADGYVTRPKWDAADFSLILVCCSISSLLRDQTVAPLWLLTTSLLSNAVDFFFSHL